MSPQFPTLLNGHIPVPLPSVDTPSPLLLSSSSHKSWYHTEHQERRGPDGHRKGPTQPGDWLPPSPIILLIWSLLLCTYYPKKQELHLEALLSEKSILLSAFLCVFTTVHRLSFFMFACRVLNFSGCESLLNELKLIFFHLVISHLTAVGLKLQCQTGRNFRNAIHFSWFCPGYISTSTPMAMEISKRN